MSKLFATLCSLALLFATASPAQAATTVAWHMDDASGVSDPAGHTLALTNVDTSSAQYWTFSGDGRATTASDDDALDPGKATLTISVMVRSSTMPSTSVGDYDLVRKGLSGTTGGYWKLELVPNDKRTRTLAFCQMSAVYLKYTPVNLTNGKWHSITCTRDADAMTVTITIDGRSKTRSLTRLRSIDNTKQMVVGAKTSTDDRYVGDMDELTISVG